MGNMVRKSKQEYHRTNAPKKGTFFESTLAQ